MSQEPPPTPAIDPLMVCPEEIFESFQREHQLFPTANDVELLLPKNAVVFNGEEISAASFDMNIINGALFESKEILFQNTLNSSFKIIEYCQNNVPIDYEDEAKMSDDEVVFVGQYRINHNKENEPGKKIENRRRNPIRKARTGNVMKSKIEAMDQELDFLEESLDKVEYTPRKMPSKRKGRPPKVWPVNVYERPEYNCETDKVEPFDKAINNKIQEEVETDNKPKETRPKRIVKPKKKYIYRRRCVRKKKASEEKTVLASELAELVQNTFDLMVKTVSQSLVDDRMAFFSLKNEVFRDLLKNQIALMAVVNQYGQAEINDCLQKVFDKV